MSKCFAFRSAFASICLAFVLSVSAQDQGTGSIRGTVVDEQGVPINGAQVSADPIDGRPRLTLVHYAKTDAEGRFLINRVKWGTYGVFAMKEESGYPNLGASLYSDDVFPIVGITSTAPVAELRIRLGPKAGVLIGSITNALTGAPVDAGLKLSRAADVKKWISTSVPPEYRVLLPSATDVLLEAFAPGFKTWTPGHPLRLEPGSEMRFDIPLERSHDPNLHPSRFLVPDGYVGWLLLEYDAKDTPTVSTEDGVKVFKFPQSGKLNTSSPGPQKGAEDEYLYYSENGSLRDISADYHNGKGMIWGNYEGSKGGVTSLFGFFVGTEEQYKQQLRQRPH